MMSANRNPLVLVAALYAIKEVCSASPKALTASVYVREKYMKSAKNSSLLLDCDLIWPGPCACQVCVWDFCLIVLVILLLYILLLACC